jgi:hypothetical protein
MLLLKSKSLTDSLQFTANDGGLTNIFFSDVKQCAQVCTLLAKDHPNMLYFWGSTSDLMTDEALSSKIVRTLFTKNHCLPYHSTLGQAEGRLCYDSS